MSEHAPRDKRPMTDLEKALTWHKLGKWSAPNSPSVKHVDAIIAELERVTGELARLRAPAPDATHLETEPDLKLQD